MRMETYPYLEALRDSLFYEDEAWGTGSENTCDCCPNPAKYMTCDGNDDSASEYYICEECIAHFKLEHKLENNQ